MLPEFEFEVKPKEVERILRLEQLRRVGLNPAEPVFAYHGTSIRAFLRLVRFGVLPATIRQSLFGKRPELFFMYKKYGKHPLEIVEGYAQSISFRHFMLGRLAVVDSEIEDILWERSQLTSRQLPGKILEENHLTATQYLALERKARKMKGIVFAVSGKVRRDYECSPGDHDDPGGERDFSIKDDLPLSYLIGLKIMGSIEEKAFNKMCGKVH